MPELAFAAAAGAQALFGAGSAIAGLTASAAALSVTGFGQAVIGLSLSLGSMALQGAFNRSQAAVSSDNVQSVVRQALASQRLLLGEPTVGGPLFFFDGEPPFVTFGILLAAHECDSLRYIHINNNKVYIGADRFATSTPFADGANKYIEASFRNGDIDQALDPIIAAYHPTVPSTFRQRGHATLVIRRRHSFGADYEARQKDNERVYGSNGFNPLVTVRGAKCHDPRRPESLVDDPSTWVWTKNNSLCFMRAVTHTWISSSLVNPLQVDWDKVALAADIDDGWETAKDGTPFRRHTCDGVVEADGDAYELVQAFRAASSGYLVRKEGKIYPLPYRDGLPVMTLTEDMVTGGIVYTAETPRSKLINTVKAEFNGGEGRDFKTVSGPVLADAALVAADGEPLERALALPFTQYHPRVQMIERRVMEGSRHGRQAAGAFDARTADLSVGDIVQIDFESKPQLNGLYMVSRTTPDQTFGGFSLTLTEHFYRRFDAAVDEQDFTITEEAA
jgi:hypothetical protein